MTRLQRRILCIRPRLNAEAGLILRVTSDEWVEALKRHAAVLEVAENFDLATVCDAFRPDLMILDAVNWTRPWPLRIDNPRSNPTIPRVLYLNSDPHDPMRPLTARMMDALGIETVFATAEAYFQHMPELRHRRCFMIPQFIDGAVYKDYNLPKSIPVSIFGGHFLNDFYAWRAEALQHIDGALPTLTYTHPGYGNGKPSPFAVFGESYARLLNRCAFSLADTTRCDYLVRKHLEIPASGAVLVAPESRALAHYGFVDGETCVLGSGADLVRKIIAVERDPARYEAIRQAGMALVHARYTAASWTYFLDWLECHRALRPGQAVGQDRRYGSFRPVADDATEPFRIDPRGRNQVTTMLADARAAVLAGTDLAETEAHVATVAGWLAHVGEPYFMAGVLAALYGDPATATALVARRANGQGLIDPSLKVLDPVELAWLLLLAHATGDRATVEALRPEAAGLGHVSLRRVFWLIDDGTAAGLTPDVLERRDSDLLSVHWMGDEDFTAWSDLVTRILNAIGIRSRAPASERPEASAA